MNYKSTKPVCIVVVFIAIACGVLDYFLPAMGDDLVFWNELGLDNYRYPDYSTFKFAASHYLGTNGRMFDWLGPVVINLLPRFFAAVMMGGMMGLYFWVMLLNLNPARPNHNCFYIVFIAIVVAVMPWWDSMWLRVCQFNYVWGTIFDLLFIYLFFKPYNRTWKVWLFLLGWCAGAAHEQTGLAMTVAFGAWCLARGNFKSMEKRRWTMLAGLILGALSTVATPSIWCRAAVDTVHDNVIHLVLTTLPVYILLLVVLIVMVLSKAGRKRLIDFFTPAAKIMLLAATVSALIAVMSGIPGRTGWFSESVSIVMLANIVLTLNNTTRRVIAIISAVVAVQFILFHYAYSIYWQSRVYKEVEDVKTLYKDSDNGVVYYDFTGRYDTPIITLSRVKGVPDADDWWLATVLQRVYGSPLKEFVVLPAAMEGVVYGDSLTVDGYTLYKDKPLVKIDGQHVIKHTPVGWLVAPLVLDPGDILMIVE